MLAGVIENCWDSRKAKSGESTRKTTVAPLPNENKAVPSNACSSPSFSSVNASNADTNAGAEILPRETASNKPTCTLTNLRPWQSAMLKEHDAPSQRAPAHGGAPGEGQAKLNAANPDLRPSITAPSLDNVNNADWRFATSTKTSPVRLPFTPRSSTIAAGARNETVPFTE